MKRNKLSLFIYILIGLAVIGLLSQLFGNTANFLMRIFFGIGIAVVIFGVLYYFMQRNRGGSSDEMKKYKQAVKQSKMKYQQQTDVNSKIKRNSKHKKTNRHKSIKRATHLRVIDGNKGKDKEKKDNVGL